MQRFRALLGFKSCSGINYCTLNPEDERLAKKLKTKHLKHLNDQALPCLIFSIVLLIIALPLTLTEKLNFKIKVFYMVRLTILCLNCSIWYILRKKFHSFVQVHTHIIYFCFAIFSFIFPDIGLGLEEIKLAFMDFNANCLAFVVVSLFLT
jgi:hypothetical protein